jgi:ABC-type phosphate/phosphonate transport system substrate-binding protein
MDDLVATKKKNKQPVLTAGSGDESSLMTQAYFRSFGLDVTYVMYTNAGAPLVDVLAGRTDVMFTTDTIAQPHVAKGASIVKFRDVRNLSVNKVQLNVFLVTRRDMPQEKIDRFLEKLRSRIKETMEQKRLSNVTLLVLSEKDTQARLTEYKNIMEDLLKKIQ